MNEGVGELGLENVNSSVGPLKGREPVVWCEGIGTPHPRKPAAGSQRWRKGQVR